MAISQDDIPLTPVDRTPALAAVGRPSWTVLTPGRLMLLVGAVGAVLLVPWLAYREALSVADPQLANLLRFMGAVKLMLALTVASAAWWRLGGPIDLSRTLAYVGAVVLLLATSLLILMLHQLPQAVAAYHGAAFALLIFAHQDRDLPKLLVR